MYLVKTPFWLRLIYPSLVWRKLNDLNKIYITFDDGPIPIVTDFVINTLKMYEAPATFFCIGDNIRKHPEVFQRLKEAGHRIGNHTFNHLKGWDTDDDVYLDNIRDCAALVRSDLLRPPYGRIRKSQIGRLKEAFPNMQIIMWDVLSGDFDQQLSPEKCLENVIKHTRPGAIIVFHDSLKAFDRLEYVLPRALKIWKDKGYVFEKL
ncbi:peptidoglycan/xylan/chitin deacetylase (PgdA/CDA1 family) [Arcticibacter pallidicorallinus]|uniref:Peptidoglycan/xylan/chitin deacetylase (PgdA/CDA1 family) n=1 Tax=Arcticibacter pallidicorallinus TaxID=1259464 RepID=A0A2T0U969_9SPHI|nr:polysaccharide deacetylase family protein [Arcticibacter pallidicorallinus]PRY54422.1 peptidoglycan/xylan/chitin deacetylase (PgdA/CDA1 family) [Arcticibacter pallidicorallinus]